MKSSRSKSQILLSIMVAPPVSPIGDHIKKPPTVSVAKDFPAEMADLSALKVIRPDIREKPMEWGPGCDGNCRLIEPPVSAYDVFQLLAAFGVQSELIHFLRELLRAAIPTGVCVQAGRGR